MCSYVQEENCTRRGSQVASRRTAKLATDSYPTSKNNIMTSQTDTLPLCVLHSHGPITHNKKLLRYLLEAGRRLNAFSVDCQVFEFLSEASVELFNLVRPRNPFLTPRMTDDECTGSIRAKHGAFNVPSSFCLLTKVLGTVRPGKGISDAVVSRA